MSTLVSNGTRLYRKSGSLVRTPITVAVAADAMQTYEVAGNYHQVGSVWYPVGGWTDVKSLANCTAVGYRCNSAYLNASDFRQVWRTVTNGQLPETVYYQGQYSTSGANLAQCQGQVEAYWRLGAYHFSIPASLQGLAVSSAKVTFNLGGEVTGYGSAQSSSSRNEKGWKNLSDTNYFTFCVVSSLGTPSQIFAAQPNGDDIDMDALTRATASGVTPTAWRDLFEFSGASWTSNYPDGTIPILSGSPTHTFSLGAGNIAAVNANIASGFWIVPLTNVAVYSSTNYLPMWSQALDYYWACVSAWGLSLEVTVD